MDIYELIKKRRTIRRFKQKEIPLELLEKFVDMARIAPSGANIQPLEYIIVNDKKIVDEIFPLTGWAGYLGKDGVPPEEKRPVAYIVVLINNDLKSPTPLPPVKRYYSLGAGDVSDEGGTSGPAGGGGTAGALFGIACLMIKNKATRIIIIRITTAAGFCFFSAIFSHLLSFLNLNFYFNIFFLICQVKIYCNVKYPSNFFLEHA